MKLLLKIDDTEHILDVDNKQFRELRVKLGQKMIALRKLGKTFDYQLINLDAPKQFIASQGLVSKATAVTTTFANIKI